MPMENFCSHYIVSLIIDVCDSVLFCFEKVDDSKLNDVNKMHGENIEIYEILSISLPVITKLKIWNNILLFHCWNRFPINYLFG